MEYHRSVAIQLAESTRNLQHLLADPGQELRIQGRAQQLQETINDVKTTHRRLLLSAEHWTLFQNAASVVEEWLKDTGTPLSNLINKTGRGRTNHEDCLEYWVRSVYALAKFFSTNFWNVNG